jgi:hypothetical protein
MFHKCPFPNDGACQKGVLCRECRTYGVQHEWAKRCSTFFQVEFADGRFEMNWICHAHVFDQFFLSQNRLRQNWWFSHPSIGFWQLWKKADRMAWPRPIETNLNDLSWVILHKFDIWHFASVEFRQIVKCHEHVDRWPVRELAGVLDYLPFVE